MAIINKTMKTFNVPNGADTIRYEIVDEAGRKCLAKDWATHSDEAFAADEYVFKDGKFYKFTTDHTAGNTWSSSEVEETNLGSEITDFKIALNGIGLGIEDGVLVIDPVTE